MTIRAEPIARGASGPAAPESAIVDRKMNVPTNSVRSLGARGIAVLKLRYRLRVGHRNTLDLEHCIFGGSALSVCGRAANGKDARSDSSRPRGAICRRAAREDPRHRAVLEARAS